MSTCVTRTHSWVLFWYVWNVWTIRELSVYEDKYAHVNSFPRHAEWCSAIVSNHREFLTWGMFLGQKISSGIHLCCCQGGFPFARFTTPCTCGRKALTFNKCPCYCVLFVVVRTLGPQTSVALPALLLFNKKVLFVMIIPFCTDRLKIWTIFQHWCSVFRKPVVNLALAQ